MSAVRNLNGVEVGGRPLRIDLADSDPFLEGKTTVRGELVDMSETRAQWREREREREREHARREHQGEDPKAFLATVPQGVQLPLGQKAEDMITNMLASLPPGQVMDVLAQMKVRKLDRSNLSMILSSETIYTTGVRDLSPQSCTRAPPRAPTIRLCIVPSFSAQQHCRSVGS